MFLSQSSESSSSSLQEDLDSKNWANAHHLIIATLHRILRRMDHSTVYIVLHMRMGLAGYTSWFQPATSTQNTMQNESYNCTVGHNTGGYNLWHDMHVIGFHESSQSQLCSHIIKPSSIAKYTHMHVCLVRHNTGG